MHSDTFTKWAIEQVGMTREEAERIRLDAVLDLFVSRIECAASRTDRPLRTITAKKAGGNSRAVTRRMLDQLRFEPHQRRAVHRLMAGSPSGWEGLLGLFAAGSSLTTEQRRYARRQVRLILTTRTSSPAASASHGAGRRVA